MMKKWNVCENEEKLFKIRRENENEVLFKEKLLLWKW